MNASELLDKYNEALEQYTQLVNHWNNDHLDKDEIGPLWKAIQEALEVKEAARKAYEEATR